ncbi:S-adenosyl-L-methionine-dependent methyltransferase [Ascobolus immersus RN42]|uniref:S-adenosyl-L-methionine-dependent methyltransferase n=1 Tax=Ascobolus immersus RN42 TaxID=1160509 RepID=A0A3N4IVI3_ASCIM|nr:S-adenosyl-L-methionine-dependent methyltransferase [Ascobolus immersus RN42]
MAAPTAAGPETFIPAEDFGNEGKNIEIGDLDDDSTYAASSIDSDTTSLSSSVFNYHYENGRRYTSQRTSGGDYALPNDEAEQERLDLMHHLFNLFMKGELYLAPIKSPKRILDVGCGTGVWAIDIADAHPDSRVIGTDLSPIQPGWLPPNVKFEVDDFEDEWCFREKFDFIHCRCLDGSVSDWPRLLKQIYDNLAPGGYVEFQESDVINVYSEDGTYEGSHIDHYTRALKEASEKSGKRMDNAPKIPQYLKDAGFVNVYSKMFKACIGTWPKDPYYKEIGKVGAAISQSGGEAYGLAVFTRVLGWSTEKAKSMIEKAVRDLIDRKSGVHAIYPQ